MIKYKNHLSRIKRVANPIKTCNSSSLSSVLPAMSMAFSNVNRILILRYNFPIYQDFLNLSGIDLDQCEKEQLLKFYAFLYI